MGFNVLSHSACLLARNLLFVRQVIEAIAAIKGIPEEEVAEAVWKNSLSVFQW